MSDQSPSASEVAVSVIAAVGKIVQFVNAFTTAHPKALSQAGVTGVNDDGTVNVVAIVHGTPTPIENVPVVAPGAEHPANGPFVIGHVVAAAQDTTDAPAPTPAPEAPPPEEGHP